MTKLESAYGKGKEQEEWEKLRAGNRNSFAIIFHQYYKDLVLYAGTFINNQMACEDVVQDFFVKLWTEREHLSPVEAVKPFLLKAIKYACLNAIRGENSRLKYGDVGKMAEECITRETEDYILYSELNERLDAVLDYLSPVQRRCFELNRLQGMKQAEVARELDMPLRTVELRIAESLKILKKHLKEYFIQVLLFLLQY